jgi:cholesterol transport system auxiliary component
MLFAVCAVGAGFMLSDCALTSKAEVVSVRYFSPEQERASVERPLPAVVHSPPLEVKLGRVFSGSNLRERIAYRDNAYELGYYEDLRWTERPETFVRRKLDRALFETQKLKRVLSGAAPTLDVELISFEDLRQETGRAVRIQLKFMLFQDREVLLEETLTVERPVPGDNPQIEAVVAAMATALEAMAQEVVMRVKTALLTRRSLAPLAPLP